MNILYIEDDHLTRESVLLFLELNYPEAQVFDFESPTSALEFLNSKNLKIDLLITDIRMPGMSGLEFIKEINSIDFYNKQDFLIIITTAYRNEDLSLDLNQDKIKIVFKPVEISKLKKLIEQH